MASYSARFVAVPQRGQFLHNIRLLTGLVVQVYFSFDLFSRYTTASLHLSLTPEK